MTALARSSMSKSGKKPVIEGFKDDKRVFHDAMRKFEVYVIKGLPHAGRLIKLICHRKRSWSTRTRSACLRGTIRCRIPR
jgi:hypothetical protein